MSNTNAGTVLPVYNGHDNKFTWIVALWLDNDYGLSHLLNQWARQIRNEWQLAERIKELVQEHNPLADDATLYSDAMHYALSLVNYHSIAQGYWDENHEDDGDEDESDID